MYYHNDILIGFICHKNIDKNTVCINYLGVDQNKKRYTEQGFASKMLEDFINQNSNKNIFSYVYSDLENYISGDSTTYIENKNLNKFNVKKLIKIFSLLDIKFRDDKECLEIKRK